MLYVRKILRPGEEIIAVGTMHWIIYAPGLFLIFAGAAIVLFVPAPQNGWVFDIIGGLVTLLGVMTLVSAWFDSWTTEIAVTNLRVIKKRGFIRRETGEMNMQKVESVTVDQSILGRILDYGTIAVRGTGSGIEGLHHIANPLALRRAISSG